MGASDPRLVGDALNIRLRRQFKLYHDDDKPPKQVKPVHIDFIKAALTLAFHSSPTDERKAVDNMMCMAFFFLLRPGEYTGTTTDDQAFSLDDVTLFLGSRELSNEHAPDHDIAAATAVSLTFTTQKNGIKGEIISHARSGNNLCCPVTAIARQFMTHRRERRRKSLPYDGSVRLASFYNVRGTLVLVKADMVTKALRLHTTLLRHSTGINPNDISARSLRAGGAMAMYIGGCDKDRVQLQGRWRSDAMMRYLHAQSRPIFERLAVTMLGSPGATFLPSDWVPARY